MPKIAEVTISGDIAGVTTLHKQLPFAALRTTNDLLDRSQKNIVRGLKRGLHIRNGWLNPRTKFGVNVQFAKKKDNIEGSVGTAADWLLEEEGYNSGVKKPDHVSPNLGRKPTALAEPIVGTARPTLMSVMPRGQKAGALLKNAKRTKAFIVKSKRNGQRLVLQRVGLDASGKRLKDSRGNLRIGRKSERKGGTEVVLKAVLRPTVRVPQRHIFTETGVKTMNANHYADRLGKNLVTALKTAKSK